MNNRRLLLIGIVLLAIIVSIIALAWYGIALKKVGKNDENIEITIPMGSTANDISNILKENKLIRSKLAFKIYVKLHKVENFKAGTYYLRQNMSTKEIIDELKTGILEDPNQITITYLEGKTIKWLAKKVSETTNNTEEDFLNIMKNEEYINSLIEKNIGIIFQEFFELKKDISYIICYTPNFYFNTQYWIPCIYKLDIQIKWSLYLYIPDDYISCSSCSLNKISYFLNILNKRIGQ